MLLLLLSITIKGSQFTIFSGENWRNCKKGGDSGLYQNRNWAMANFDEEQMIIPPQMIPGKTGRQVELLPNYYEITTSDVVVEYYDVEITKTKNERAEKIPSAGTPRNEVEAVIALAAARTEEANKAFGRFLSRCSNSIIKALAAKYKAIFKDLH